MDNNLFAEPNIWFDQSENLTEATTDERLNFFIESMKHASMNAAFAEEAGVGDFLLTLFSDLVSEKRFDALIQLKQTISIHQPEFDDTEFSYINPEILKYALYIGDDALAKQAFAQFIANPNKDIDSYLPRLRLIALYGKSDWVEEIVLENYSMIKEANDEYVGNPHQKLAVYMWHLTSEASYKKYCSTGVFDMKNWLAQLDKVDFNLFEEADKIRIEKELTTPVPDKQFLSASLQKNTWELLFSLEAHFMKYNYDQKGISFVISGIIWNLMSDFWLDKSRKKNPLHLTNPAFDKYCAEQRGMFGGYHCDAVATVYGAYYAYDFLYHIGLVNDFIYKDALSSIAVCQNALNTLGDLSWKYGFTKFWAKPDGMSETLYHATINNMNDAFTKVEIIQHKKENWQEMLGNLVDKIAPIKNQPLAPHQPIISHQPIAPHQTVIKTTPKVGRNEPCPCGSGKKYKHCCGK
jgi:SEC-C motif